MRWVGYLVLIATELAVYNQFSRLRGPSDAFYGYFIVMAVMTFIAIFFHEMGHAIAVWRSGGTVHSINVSFIRYNVAKRRLETAPRSKSSEVGGYVAYAFETRLGTPRKEIQIAAAGPAANVLTGIAALLLVLYLTPPIVERQDTEAVVHLADSDDMKSGVPMALPPQAEVDKILDQMKNREVSLSFEVLLTAFATLSFGLALANLVPFRGSDGAAIIRNWRKPKPKFGMR